jgi:DNA-binding MarR family transcriptional regulator
MPFPDGIDLVCFGNRARMAARAVTRSYNARLKSLDLHITQLSILIALVQGDSASVAQLADRLDTEPSTLVRNLQILERRNLVIGDDGRGRRGRRFVLTAAGQALLDQAGPIWRQAQADMTTALKTQSDATFQALIRLEAAALTINGETQ